MNVDRRGSVPIGARTLDNRVHVRWRGFPGEHAFILMSLMGLRLRAVRMRGRPAPTGSGQNGSDPPDRHAPIGTVEGWHVHSHATPCSGVAPVHGSLREGCIEGVIKGIIAI